MTLRPHPKNSAGPFYVEDGCCTSCGVPEIEAPTLFGWVDHHCFVGRQPETEEELDQMTNAILFAELDCIRYRGGDEAYIRRLGENGLLKQVDFSPNKFIAEIIRDHVLFEIESIPRAPIDLATEYCEYLKGSDIKSQRYKFLGPYDDPLTQDASLDYSWFQDRFHRVNFSRGPQNIGFLIQIRSDCASRSMAKNVYDWLRGRGDLMGQKWFSEQQWIDRNIEGQSKPA